MYQISYFIFFYTLEIIIVVILLAILLISGFFDFNAGKREVTIQSLISSMKNAKEDIKALDSIMEQFYTNFYSISPQDSNFNAWLEFIQQVTIIDYMSFEQVAEFRDELIKNNPNIKSEIERSIGTSLKRREEKKT